MKDLFKISMPKTMSGKLSMLLVAAIGLLGVMAMIHGDFTSGNVLFGASACAKISRDKALNCNDKLSGGVKDVLYLFNYDDIIDVTYSITSPQTITGIVLASGARGYRWEGKNNSIAPELAFKRGTYDENYEHKLGFILFSNTEDDKDDVEALGTGRYVGIVENNLRRGSSNVAFEIYGIDSGMLVPDGGITRMQNDADTHGAYNISLQSSEKSREGHLPATFLDTDYDTTKAALLSLTE